MKRGSMITALATSVRLCPKGTLSRYERESTDQEQVVVRSESMYMSQSRSAIKRRGVNACGITALSQSE